ncbi:MAG: cell division/cell wall cluster transcriptional repressor MraZ, partial [Polyangiales bacterium]
MFRGRYEHAIDAKGRTSVPSRFREVMTAHGDSQLVLTTGLDSCLVAYPMAEWLAFEKRLSELPQ